MTMLWIHWQRPWWSLLLPMVLWLLWRFWCRGRQTGFWRDLLPAQLHSVLLSGRDGRNSRLSLWLLVFGMVLAVIALSGPGWRQIEQPVLKGISPLVVVLDLSPAMLSPDLPPNRLTQARHKVTDLLQSRDGEQAALVVYAGSAHTVVPLSDDLRTTTNLLQALTPSIMPEAGRRADLGVARAVQMLQRNSETKGDILLITSALDSEERQGINAALRNSSYHLSILGAGTLQGEPVRLADGSFLKDRDGNILLPRLEDQTLAETARENAGRYATIQLGDNDLKALNLAQTPDDFKNGEEQRKLNLWQDQGYCFLLPLLLIAALAGRKGWLFCLPLLLVMSPPDAQAFQMADLWRTPDQQGQQLMRDHKPEEATNRFADPQWKGNALYESGHYNEALQQFRQDSSATGYYNQGNALARQGRYQEALEAWEQAMDIDPQLEQAKKNHYLVKKMLEQQQQKNQDQKQGQQKQNPQQNGNGQQQEGSDQQSSSGQSGQQQPSGSPNNSSQDQQQGNQSPDTSAQPQQAQSQRQESGPENGNNHQNTENGKNEGAGQAAQQAGRPDQQQRSDTSPRDTRKESKDGEPSPSQSVAGKTAEDSGHPPRDKPLTAIDMAPLSDEQKQSLEQWLRQVPDDPSELLRRKFYYEQQIRKEGR